MRAILVGGTDDERLTLTKWLQHDGDIDVIDGGAAGPELTQPLDRVHADLVIATAEMATSLAVAEIVTMLRPSRAPIIAVIDRIASGSSEADEILAAGATEVIPRTQLRTDEPGSAQAVTVRHRIRRRVRANGGYRETGSRSQLGANRSRATRPMAVAICASTGGPQAIEQILTALPGDYPLPILVVQHIADGFMNGFVEWLNTRVSLPVSLARDGMELGAGAWFAPDDADLVLLPSLKLALERSDQDRIHRPSADALLESMAEVIGSNAVGVVLTGMGRDGGDGVAALRRRQACVIAQDEASSVIFGMPRTAIERGAQLVLPLSQIAPELMRIARNPGL